MVWSVPPAALYSTVLAVERFIVEKLFGKLLPETPPLEALSFNFEVEKSENVPPDALRLNVLVPKSRTDEPFTVRVPVSPALEEPVNVTMGLFVPVPIVTLLKFPTLLLNVIVWPSTEVNSAVPGVLVELIVPDGPKVRLLLKISLLLTFPINSTIPFDAVLIVTVPPKSITPADVPPLTPTLRMVLLFPLGLLKVAAEVTMTVFPPISILPVLLLPDTVNVREFIVSVPGAPLNVIVVFADEIAITASSAEPGIPDGFQFVVVFQSLVPAPAPVPIQFLVTAKENSVMNIKANK